MLKVLIVDDEPWVLEGLRTMIDWGEYGFEVCAEALNGSDALRLIQEHQPDLVLTDINMPVINGLELIAQIHELMVKPPRFVILSGYDDFEYARVALRQRVNEYLLKPIDDEEIESLLDRLSTVINDENASSQQHHKKRAFIVKNIINRLIQGEYNESLELLSRNLMKLNNDSELLCILMKSTSPVTDFNQQINEYFPEGSACLFQDGAGRTGIIVQADSISSENVDAAVYQIRRDLEKHMQEPAIVAVSDRLIGLRTIQELYSQSLEVWKLKYQKEKSGVFYYKELRNIKNGNELEEQGFEQLLAKVQVNDELQIQASVKAIFASYSERQFSIEAVQALVAHLELTICRLIAEMKGDPNRIMKKLQAEFGNLGELSDYFLLRNYVHRLCQQTAGYLSELKRQNEGDTIYNVIRYVDHEFRNKLQLQELARQFHMNSTYLGQLFRKKTGQSFNEYVNGKRIEEAKTLLKRTQLKIFDIAVQVGFSNADYFIDKFKMSVGVVPSAYKNENKNKQL
ncbi:response regulator transcription factor [Paenibacillus donghaensis]|uniref:DNA-binding response regulator n=1 Tax=Paenibacillus donghaensis TaxID=414771 RepID=A0A2Z2KV57_9BACL|nr:response regulator [Paenibacillus donghaensis]ASA26092.1 hypothetical protein B9T62_38510 [Paenibacillus donghaensis]